MGAGVRFIPTPVGNVRASAAELRYPAVHPHACGERFIVSGLIIYVVGSSPRLWGT